MFAKPTVPLLIKFVLIIVIVVELIVIGTLMFGEVRGGGQPASNYQVTVPEEQSEAQLEEGNGSENPDEGENAEDEQKGEEAKPVKVKVTFAGDCTLGTDANYAGERSFNARYQDIKDVTYYLKNVADLFGKDDLTVVNMEGTLTEGGERQEKEFAFRGLPEYAGILSSASVESASMANNHSHDYGDQSYTDTIEALEGDNVSTFGYDRIAYEDVKGVKVALIGTYALDTDPTQEMTDNIKKAREEGAQLVLVYAHWGIEKDSVPNEEQMKLGRAAIDAGADLVVGSHPHVIQGYEVYEGRYIVYSLGNFCFGGNTNPQDKDCMIFQQTFTVKGNDVEKNDKVKFIPCSVSSQSDVNDYQPTIAKGSEKERIMDKIQESTDAIAEKAKSL